MLLRTSVNSPFGRKVRATAEHLGLADRIERVDTDFRDPNDDLRKDNPLGKMPVLVCGDGMALFDSAVIVDYLDSLAGGVLCASSGSGRWRSLQTQALADGIMDAGVLLVLENVLRPEQFRSTEWQDFQRGKMERGIDAIALLADRQCTVDVGSIATACMLEWTEFRQLINWRIRQPRLVAWLDQFNALVPTFRNTAPA